MKRLLLIALLVGIAVPPVLAQAEMLDTMPRIAIMSAFEPELALLRQETAVEATYTVNGVEFTTGALAGNDVVLFLSGVSTVNAAMNTQVALDHFHITHLIFSGIAGGVNPDLNIGDVTVPHQWGQYLETAFARENPDGAFSPPPFYEYPFENFGMMFPRPVHVRTAANPAGEDRFWFVADIEMLGVASHLMDSVTLNNCTSDNVCLSHQPRLVVGGNGVSGPAFVDNAAFREYAFTQFQANVLDMETASVAMVAYANNVPYIAFRSLSDLAGGGPGENEIGTFFALAADNSARVVIDFLAAWAGHCNLCQPPAGSG